MVGHTDSYDGYMIIVMIIGRWIHIITLHIESELFGIVHDFRNGRRVEHHLLRHTSYLW